VWDSCPGALSQEGQFILLISSSIDPQHPLGSAGRLDCGCAFIESTPSGTSSVRLMAVAWSQKPVRPGYMDAQDAINQLSGVLIKEGHDRYRFAHSKTVLFVRLLGTRTPIRFAACDRVVFRIDAANLTVEDLKTHTLRNAFPWNRIESLAAGEPESENSDLFQG